MNGDTAGLESTDSGGKSDPRSVRRDQIDAFGPPREWYAQVAAFLEQQGEYKAAREVEDALARLDSAGAFGEGERSSEGVHGQNPPEAEERLSWRPDDNGRFEDG